MKYFIDTGDIEEVKKCEKCGKKYNGSYGFGRFCSTNCAHSRTPTQETRKKMSMARKGKHSNMKNKYHTEETKEKISKNNSKYWLNKKRSEKTKKKISNTKRGKPSLKKGVPLSEEIKRKISISKKNPSEETRKKIRMARCEQIRNNYGISAPAYNLKACKYFKEFDIKNNTQGRYAAYGNGEAYLNKAGYFVDYFNEDLKLIIEWDEEKHYTNNKLKNKDVIRQKSIKKEYPDFNFIRIRERDVLCQNFF